MTLTEQPRDVRQVRGRLRPDTPVDVAEDLAAELVVAEEARRTGPPVVFEVAQQPMHERRLRPGVSPYRVTHPDGVGQGATGKRYLLHASSLTEQASRDEPKIWRSPRQWARSHGWCDDETVPRLVDPALPARSFQTLDQPRLDVDAHLALRPWRDDDSPIVRKAFACPEIQRWHLLRIDSDDEARAWITAWARRWNDETDASWAIVNTSDEPVGQVGLRTLSLPAASAQLSYWVLPSARGNGIAVRATRALTRWSFAEVGLQRMVVEHSIANRASCRVATNAGFRVEGTHRGAVLHADGWHDMHVHAQLRTD